MNRTAFTVVLTALCSILGPALSAQSPCPTCAISERGDRLEGIEVREQVSGGSFELLSVHYLTSRETAAKGSKIRVFFWSPGAGQLDELKVWQPARYYRMEPLRREFGEGLSQFSWGRAEVIDPMQLSTDTLYARIRSGDTFLPALLTTEDSPVTKGGYAFVFESGAGIDADCTVVRKADGSPVKTFECFEDYGGAITIEWDGKDNSGQQAADGLYVLKVDGDMLAETIRPLMTSVTFRHQASLN